MIHRIRMWLWKRRYQRLVRELREAMDAMDEASMNYSGRYLDFELWDCWRETVDIVSKEIYDHESRRPKP